MAEWRDLLEMLWGSSRNRVTDSLFRRWTQGFVFSRDEPTALEQFEGGPCAVIAPVQAFLLKWAFFGDHQGNWQQCSDETRRELLSQALCEILEQAAPQHSGALTLVGWRGWKEQNEQDGSTTSQPDSSQSGVILPRDVVTFERFHNLIQSKTVGNGSDLRATLLEHFPIFTGSCGVLLFLYSLLLTKGIENIKNETEDPNVPLIDPEYGHGSQSLINLLLTGLAVSNVWDGEKECSGIKLYGIRQQATVGFLTLMEAFRYCQVGSFLKSPKYPIWVLGSETHLTVFFTKELSLVLPESPADNARRVFKTFDLEDNGFIPEARLEEIMKTLDLFADPEYVNLMKGRLDPESLGLILLGPFLTEFFAEEENNIPESFSVFHYNGLRYSCPHEKVRYTEGTAIVKGFQEPSLATDDAPCKSCLQTKWPAIEVLWTTEHPPSLN
uniref:Ubiquitin carboxyl-terminal hydrolase MINDY n=1 Tax=Eptatretus burgeri TaxID=7764 RepID=A0A8C4WU57_EPTBU